MHHRYLREIAKFCAGLIAADIFTFIWLWSNKLFPINFLGIAWSSSTILPGIIFDLALLIILFHYGWHLGKIPRPRERTYLFIAGIIFTIVGAAHLVRIFTGADFVVMGWDVPLWLSWVGTAVAAYLAYASFCFSVRRSR